MVQAKATGSVANPIYGQPSHDDDQYVDVGGDSLDGETTTDGASLEYVCGDGEKATAIGPRGSTSDGSAHASPPNRPALWWTGKVAATALAIALAALAIAILAFSDSVDTGSDALRRELDATRQSMIAMETTLNRAANATAVVLERPRLARTRCERRGDIPGSNTFYYYQFQPEDCSPFYPTGDCDALLSILQMAGADYDWGALSPGEEKKANSVTVTGPAAFNYCPAGYSCDRVHNPCRLLLLFRLISESTASPDPPSPSLRLLESH